MPLAERTAPSVPQHATYSQAISRVARLADRIRSDLRADLAMIADDDRAEQNSFRVAAVIARWLSEKVEKA
jgi:hypothetical protein